MQIIHRIAELHAALPEASACAFVPTMGNLHDGHLALIQQAHAYGLPVVASIFVNRLQFGPNEDFDRYPRTLERDAQRLREAACSHLFVPDERELYPRPQTFKVQPEPALAEILEGHFRPGFFTGVATVVMKLFSIVRPRVAVFGKKDYQQLLVIRRMVEQFALPITIASSETGRADDGLALSSRNGYLSASERRAAPALSQALRALAEAFRTTPAALLDLEARSASALRAAGWEPDYLTIRRRTDLQPPTADDAKAPLVALGAARIGSTRLIDSLEF